MIGDEIHQCLLDDGVEERGRLLGVEYVISDKTFRALPDEEKRFWHPHTYEVLAGDSIAPGMPPADDEKYMKGLLTTWGKTWHTWPNPKTPVPMGVPMLTWSHTSDGQDDKEVFARRADRWGRRRVSTTTRPDANQLPRNPANAAIRRGSTGQRSPGHHHAKMDGHVDSG